ncbi:MAG: AsmA family protein [Lactobacillales bacterium]|nr:AsmA family protein [Lactobacillales bacterium]
MKKFLIAFVVLVILGLGGLTYFLAKSLNSESYEQQIIQIVSKLTGRELSIRGGTSVGWRPLPTIVMKEVTLSNHSISPEPLMMVAESVLVEIEWASLFKRPLVVKNIEIVNPTIMLEQMGRDDANWHFNFMTSAAALDDAQIMSNQSAISTKIERVGIKNGDITYVNRLTNTLLRLANVNGDLALASLKGPFDFNGKGAFNKVPFDITFHADEMTVSAPTHFDATVREGKSQFNMVLRGIVYPSGSENENTQMTADGSFTVQKPHVFTNNFGIGSTGEMEKPAVGNFSIDVTENENILKNMTIRFGELETDMAITGSVTQTFPDGEPMSIVADIAINTLNIDAWKSAIAGGYWEMLNPELAPSPIFVLKLNIPSLVLNNNVIRNFETEMAYQDGYMDIANTHAVFPGNTAMDIWGVGEADNGIPKLQLEITGQSGMPLEFLRWLGVAPKNPVPGTYQQASFESRAIITDSEFGFAVNTLKIDSSNLSGLFARSFEDKSQIAAVILFENMNLDAYLGLDNSGTATVENLPSLIQKSFSELKFAADLKSKFDFNFKDTTFKNMPIITGRFMGTIGEGTLHIESLALRDMATANLEVVGRISGLGQDNIILDNVNIDFSARQLPLFLQRAGLTSDLPAIARAQNASVKGTVSGGTGNWAIDLTSRLSDVNAHIAGNVSSTDLTTVYKDLDFDVSHPNFPVFMQLIAPNFKNIPALEGQIKAKGILNGSPRDFKISDGEVNVGQQKMTGSVSYSDQSIKKLSADLTATTVELDRFLRNTPAFVSQNGFSTQAFDLSALENWEIDLKLAANQLTYRNYAFYQTKTDASIKNKVMTVSEFSGETRGQKVSPFKIIGDFSWVSTPSLKTTFSIQDIPLRPDFMLINRMSFGGGTGSFDGNITATGSSPADMVTNLNGSGKITLQDNQIIGMDLPQMPLFVSKALREQTDRQTLEGQITRLLNSGKTTISSLSGTYTISNGVIRAMDLTLATPDATATPTQISWNLSAGSAEMSIPIKLNAYNTLPPIVLSIQSGAGGLSYEQNTSDFIDAVTGTIDRNMSEAARQAQIAEQQRLAAAEQERQEKIKAAIAGANQIYQQIQQDVLNFPTQRAQLLLQSTSDALSVVNSLSAKENLNDQEYARLMEQARLVQVRAGEIQNEFKKDEFFEKRKNVLSYIQQGNTLIEQMMRLQQRLPYVAVLPNLVEQSEKNIVILEKASGLLVQNVTQKQAGDIMAAAQTAYDRIVDAYEQAVRFESVQPAGGQTQQPSGLVSGSIGR